MSRRIDFTLTDEQLVTVEQAMYHASLPEVRQRVAAMRSLHLGYKPETVAQMLAVAPSSIWNWHRRYRAAGLQGLANRAKGGRPSRADATYVSALERALDTDPRQLGYAFWVWTINKLRKYLEQQTGILLSYTRFRALLRKQDYIYRQPKHDGRGLQDEAAKTAAEDLLAWLKKRPSQTTPSSSSLWTNCPFLNAIEGFWLLLQTLAAANCLHRAMDDLIQAIELVIQHQNQSDHPDCLDFAQNFRLTT